MRLPPRYAQHHDLFADWDMPYWRLLIYANVLALIPLGAAALCLWLPYQFYLALGAPYALPDPNVPAPLVALAGFAVIAVSVVAHELLHGLALHLMGLHARLRFAYGFLYAAISDGEYLTRRQYVVMALTPLIIMTAAGAGMLIILPPALGQWVLIALLLNAAASIGDLSVARRVLGEPAHAYFAANENAIFVYLPADKPEPLSAA